MDNYKCAGCGRPAPLHCRACGCVTLERVRPPPPRPALIDPATVSAQLVAMLEPDLRALKGNDHD